MRLSTFLYINWTFGYLFLWISVKVSSYFSIRGCPGFHYWFILLKYILGRSPLLVTEIWANFFILWLAFSLLWQCLLKQKFLTLMQFSLLIFSFMLNALYVLIRELHTPKVIKLFPLMYSRSFIILLFTFRFIVHLELVWGKGQIFPPRVSTWTDSIYWEK